VPVGVRGAVVGVEIDVLVAVGGGGVGVWHSSCVYLTLMGPVIEPVLHAYCV
jgi:hypothetical protein